MTDASTSSNQNSVDLSNCDREPIHLAGAIQPHAALLAFELRSLTLRHYSQNIQQWLSVLPEVGMTLEDLFDEASIAMLHSVVRGLRGVVRPMTLRPIAASSEEPFSVAAHVYRGMLIVEFEHLAVEHKADDQLKEQSLPLQLTLANQRLQRCDSLPQLYQVVADEMREISGFDRVMLYRFAEDNHGEVIGESVVEGRESFLGLHYPASDIPEQARRLYVLNTVRSIGDVNGEPVRIVPPCNADAKLPLDLSLSCFRAVSPIHIEYLKNMGVGASMSISIVIENRLWGLIACHHYDAKLLRLEERAACEIMGLVIGNYLSAREQSEVNHERARRRQSYHKVLDLITQTPEIWRSGETIWPELQQIVESSGLTVISQRGTHSCGSTTNWEGIDAILRHVEALPEEQAGNWFSHSLADDVPGYPAESTTCGCLAVPLSAPDARWLLFFRDEYVSEVSWAGNPDKSALESKDGIRLSPRKSFEQWVTTVHRQSKYWSLVDREMAEELRSGLVELLSLRAAELARLNEELANINADLDSFAYAASHDLREPLRGIRQVAFLLQRELGDDLTEGAKQRLAMLTMLSSRMDELIQGLLKLSRAGKGNLDFETISLKEVAEEAVEMVVGRPTPHGIEFEIECEASLWADFLTVRELLTNLITNAIKYNVSDVKRVTIGVWNEGDAAGNEPAVYFVRDNGIGIANDNKEEVFQIFRRLHLPEEYGGGSGAGLTICQKIVNRHGGKIWIDSEPGTGTSIFFTLEKVES